MKHLTRALAAAALAALSLAPSRSMAGTLTQASRYASSPVTLGVGGYRLNYMILWVCDDAPQQTTSAPGRIDLLDGTGSLVASLTGTVGGGRPLVSTEGVGSVSGSQVWMYQLGAGGTPANGLLSGTWLITGPAPGAYTLRFWYYQEAVSGSPASTITTQASDGGGSGEVNPAPTPTPTSAPAPAVSLAAPASATAFAPVAVSATASVQAGGSPLASISIEASFDNGDTWSPVSSLANPSGSSPTDTASYAFAQAGGAVLRATALDTSGLSAFAQQAVSVAKASQAAVSISPASVSVTQGQSVSFTASGGMTGNYAWGGAAAGAGAAQSVAFPATGTYAVTVSATGNANFNPSAAATATVSVQAAFFTLSVAASPGGSVAGGGSYPRGSMATAQATPSAGFFFGSWSGDQTGPAPQLSVLMNANKSVTASFTSMLAQTLSYAPPGAVSVRSAPFAVAVTASSGLPVILTLNSGPATLAGLVLSPGGTTGLVALTATQPGNAEYLPAPPLAIDLSIGPPPQGVIFSDDSARTKRSDRAGPVTSYVSGPIP
jgi:hypothetical protein